MSQWIPVSQPPPSDEDDFFCGFNDSKEVLFTDGRRIHAGYRREWEDSEYGPDWVISGRDGYKCENVIAWMPLPELPGAGFLQSDQQQP
jgi:hypothetical protein